MTVIIITTIGFKEVRELSYHGRIFTIIFSLLGYIGFFVSMSIFSSIIIEFILINKGGNKRMLEKISKLKHHYIICGIGKVGKNVVSSLLKLNETIVLIDTNDILAKYPEFSNNEKILYITGDATNEDILISAGIKNAKGLVTSVRDDAINLFIALTAKKLNPNLKISTYVLDEKNISKFYSIGVDEIISGDSLIGERLALSLTNKNIFKFIEQTNIINSDQLFYVGDITIKAKSKFIGNSIKEANIYRKIGLLIFAIKKHNEAFYKYNPDPDTILEENDILITFGSKEQIENLDKYINFL